MNRVCYSQDNTGPCGRRKTTMPLGEGIQAKRARIEEMHCELIATCNRLSGDTGAKKKQKLENEIIRLATGILLNIDTRRMENSYAGRCTDNEEDVEREEMTIISAAEALVELGHRGTLALLDVMKRRLDDMTYVEQEHRFATFFGSRITCPILEKGTGEDRDAFFELGKECPELGEMIVLDDRL